MRSALKIGYGLYQKQIASDRAFLRWENFWNWIEPISMALIFWFLYQYKALSVQSNYPYSLFVISGLLLWQTIIDCLNIPMSELSKYKAITRQIDIPPISIITSFFLKIHRMAFARMMLILILTVAVLKSFHIGIIIYCVYVELVIFLILGGGVILSLFNAVMADFSKIVNILMRALLFVSGVVFPISSNNDLYPYLSLSPLFKIINDSRAILFSFDTYSILNLLIMTIISLFSISISFVAFNRSIKWLFERV